jgi:hypothetical protein
MNRHHVVTAILLVCSLGPVSLAQSDTITGLGTTNYVTKFTGTNTVGNSVMFQYLSPTGNGNYIGINTVTPLGSLGILSQNGYEIFGEGAVSPWNHFNIASHNPMHIQPGVNVDGSTFNALAYLGLGAGGLADLVTLERKKLTVVSTVGVGIGATPDTEFTAGYRLKVNGKIRAKEVKVDANWSDFVFAPDYHLTPLDELEHSIKTDGHLPGIPTAAEVDRDGIAVGKMNALLLQKVEELTLYVIELSKENRALRAKVSGAGE